MSKAFQAAEEEGLRFFWATTHVGGRYQFVGDSWESGGFHCDENGEPITDGAGNTVANSCVEELDPSDDGHVAQCEEWYG